MLEKHRPIKDSVFYKEWWDEQWILGELAQWRCKLNLIVWLNLIPLLVVCLAESVAGVSDVKLFKFKVDQFTVSQ